MIPGSLTVQAWPRLHLGLIDLGTITERRYGGAGCSVAGPPVEVVAEPADRLSVELSVDAERRTHEDLRGLEARLLPVLEDRGARVEVVSLPPQHIGLGSKTALMLATATATLRAAGVETSRAELQRLSGRGGTSGAGINLFFEGGFIVDGGHPNAGGGGFEPSSSGAPTSAPPVLARHSIPEHWRFQLIRGAERGISGREERELFRSATPIGRDEVLDSLSAMHHAVLPGFALGEIELVARGLVATHRVGFKRRELEGQPTGIRELYGDLAEIGSVASGLSSVGPLLFAITDSEQARDRVANVIGAAGAQLLGCVGPINGGYTLHRE